VTKATRRKAARSDMKKVDIPPPCPECGAEPVLTDRSAVGYGAEGSGMVWTCSKYPSCDTYVGCHPGTTRPLGTLAGGELRSIRKQAHRAFDWAWKHGGMTRSGAYGLLSEKLSLPEDEAHIAMMDEARCRETIQAFNALKPWKSPRR